MMQRMQRGWDKFVATGTESTATKVLYHIYELQKTANQNIEIKKANNHDRLVNFLGIAINDAVHYENYVKLDDGQKNHFREIIAKELYSKTQPQLFDHPIFNDVNKIKEQILIVAQKTLSSDLAQKQLALGEVVASCFQFQENEANQKRNCIQTVTTILHRVMDFNYFYQLLPSKRDKLLVELGTNLHKKFGNEYFGKSFFLQNELFVNLKNTIIALLTNYENHSLIESVKAFKTTGLKRIDKSVVLTKVADSKIEASTKLKP